MWKQILKVLLLVTHSQATHIPARETTHHITWTRDLQVGTNYHIRWSSNDPEYLVMEISAPVRGYVAVGFSPNGAMRGSDIVMGWVDSLTGHAFIKDLHGIGNTVPVEDDKNDYELLWAEERDNRTTIRFRRKWDTCDGEQDYEITEDTVRLIWAVGDNDPVDMEAGAFVPKYHGPDFRGSHSVFLKVPTHLSVFPDDAVTPDPSIHHWDAKVSNVLIDSDVDTTYRCKIFKAPEFQDSSIKHQIIGFRASIDERNSQWVHHINFFECSVPQNSGQSEHIFEKYLDHPGEQCYTRNMPPEWSAYCITFPFAWAAGAEGLMFPEHGGIPLHEHHNGTTYFMLEIHYDNPKKLKFTDNSGLRLFITEHTRKNDFGSASIHDRIGQFQLIPPHSPGFINTAYCTGECTNSVFPSEGITITHVVLHGHLTARKLRFRHIRNGKELPPIAQDLHYDFNYQQSRVVSPERRVMRGDILMIECEYDTRGRGGVTYGGISTRDEMCEAIVTYYPKIQLAYCRTQYEFHNFFDALGIHRVEGDVLQRLQLPYKPKPNQLYDPGDDAYILKNVTNGDPQHPYPFDLLYVTDPQKHRNQTVREYVNALDWTGDDGKLTKEVWRKWWEGEHVALCTGPSMRRIPLENYTVKYPVFEPYTRPISSNCMLSGVDGMVVKRVNAIINVILLSLLLCG